MEDLLEKSEVEETLSRRSFLKKAAYTAPAIITLGALNAHADATPGSSVFTINTYSGTAVTGSTTVTGHNGVVDSGTTVYGPYTNASTATEVNANTYHIWDNFKQFFAGIN